MLSQTLFEAQIIAPTIYDFQALLEDRIDFIKNKYKGSLDALVDHIAKHVDPTKNKKYTEWLVQRHLKGDDVLHPDVPAHLRSFERAKSTAHDTNIKNHTLESLRDVAHIVDHQTATTKAGSLNQIYSKDGVTGFSIPDKATSIALYGPGKKFSAKWCTSTPTGNNMFDLYEGGKYTMHFPNGHFMQIHHESGQAKDPENQEIDFASDERYKPYRSHIHEFMKQTADLDRYSHEMPERHFGIGQEQFEEEYRDYKANGYNSSFLKHAETNKLSDDMVHTLMQKGWISKISRNPQLSENHVNLVLDHFIKHPDRMNSEFALNPQLKGHHIHKLIDTGESTYIRRLHLSPNLNHSHIDRLLDLAESNHPSAGAAHVAISNTINSGKVKFTDSHIRKIYRNNIEDHDHICENQTLPDDIRPIAFKKTMNDVRHSSIGSMRLTKIVKHQNLDHDELHELIDNASAAPRFSDAFMASAMTSPRFNSEHLHRVVKHIHGLEDLSGRFVTDEKVPHEVIKSWMQSKDAEGSRRHIGFGFITSYLSRSDSSAQVIHDALKQYNPSDLTANDLNGMGFHSKKDLPKELLADKHHAPYIAKSALKHPEFTKDDLHTMLGGLKDWGDHNLVYPSSTAISNVLSHPNANTSHFHRSLDNWGDDWMTRKAIENHPKTPPSVHHRLMTTDFDNKE